MLRDEKDWDPATMIRTTKSFGGRLPMEEETFQTMRRKEKADQRVYQLWSREYEAQWRLRLVRYVQASHAPGCFDFIHWFDGKTTDEAQQSGCAFNQIYGYLDIWALTLSNDQFYSF